MNAAKIFCCMDATFDCSFSGDFGGGSFGRGLLSWADDSLLREFSGAGNGEGGLGVLGGSGAIEILRSNNS